jgi:monoamine oxidase
MSNTVDVVVIGAGAAGLAAGRALGASGFTSVVLEADARIGGRAHTEIMPDGAPFDLGCHWMHSASLNPFVKTADALGVRYERREGYGRSGFFRQGAWVEDAEVATAFRAMDERQKRVAAAWSQGLDQSVFDTVDRDGPWTEVLDFYDTLNTSSDVDQISIGDLVSYNDTEENWPVVDGYGALVSRWAATVPVSLNTAATSVRWGNSGVTVETKKGQIKAKCAVICVSTGVLASGDIRFVPELPSEKQDAISALPLGNYNRIRLEIDRDVFPDDVAERVVVERTGHPPIQISLGAYGFNCAIGIVAGRHADWLERAGTAASREAVIDALCHVFGNDLRTKVKSDRQSAWRGNPFVRGAYSTSVPGQFHQRSVLAQPVADRLFFCGEATSTDHFCTCHGARMTGERAVREVQIVLTDQP